MPEKSRRSSSKIMQRHPGGSRSIKTKTRKSSATIVEKTKGPRGGSTRYRFPMPDKSHARSALAMLPKAKRGRYLPESAWKSLSSSEKKATNASKRQGTKKGKQFVKQPKDIAKKTARHR